MKYRRKKEDARWMRYTKCAICLVCLVAFLIWIKSWWGIIAAPFIIDAYITKKINWGWWRDLENPIAVTIMSWVDAIVFALVAVYFINIYFFQNYTIPSSSLEKSLLVGDYLFVSKTAYGPRKPQTPLSMPLMQHTWPWLGVKSYLEWPAWDYERVSPHPVTLNDIVVFNYPAGDTVCLGTQYETEYYTLCYAYGREICRQQNGALPNISALTPLQQRALYQAFYAAGRSYIESRPDEFGRIGWRPVDRRENYVKRCVGLPGQTLEIKDHIVYLDGKANKEPDNVQYNYRVKTNTALFPYEAGEQMGISHADIDMLNRTGVLPLTAKGVEQMKACKQYVESVEYCSPEDRDLYPQNAYTGWTVDNYGPIWIPKKGASIDLNLTNLPIYERCITAYEGNTLDVTADGDIVINGTKANSYTFKMDYYWMQGDNRHNSADSRFWGFVPEDHVVGRPVMIWLSLDPDKAPLAGGIRWNRLFRWVESYN